MKYVDTFFNIKKKNTCDMACLYNICIILFNLNNLNGNLSKPVPLGSNLKGFYTNGKNKQYVTGDAITHSQDI